MVKIATRNRISNNNGHSIKGNSSNGEYQLNIAVANALTQRTQALANLLDPDRDLDKQLDYPIQITANNYEEMFERNDVSERVVKIYPDECWAVSPIIQENSRKKKSKFEKALNDLWKKLSIDHYLHRFDVLTGIGRYGILYLGIKGGNSDLKQSVVAYNEKANEFTPKKDLELMFVRPFQESMVDIASYVTDPTNPRYGLPLLYNIKVGDSETNEPMKSQQVHWSRVIHGADNRTASEVYGTPRMRPVFNRLFDLRKLLGGSAEMFWKGAFPGYAFEVNPDYAAAAGLNEDTAAAAAFKTSMRSEFSSFSENLQRYMALVGIEAKSLAPQVASPEFHIEAQLMAIAVTLGIPIRIFLGSEEGKLASSQDLRHWNRRLKRRHHLYLTPMVVRPFIDRLMQIGVLPESKDYLVDWPDLDTLTEQDKADVADKQVTTLQKYVTGNCDQVIPPYEFLTMVMRFTDEESQLIMAEAEKHTPMSLSMATEMQKIMPSPTEGGASTAGGGGANMKQGKPAGGQTPKSGSKDRSRAGSGASGTK